MAFCRGGGPLNFFSEPFIIGFSVHYPFNRVSIPSSVISKSLGKSEMSFCFLAQLSVVVLNAVPVNR